MTNCSGVDWKFKKNKTFILHFKMYPIPCGSAFSNSLSSLLLIPFCLQPLLWTWLRLLGPLAYLAGPGWCRLLLYGPAPPVWALPNKHKQTSLVSILAVSCLCVRRENGVVIINSNLFFKCSFYSNENWSSSCMLRLSVLYCSTRLIKTLWC